MEAIATVNGVDAGAQDIGSSNCQGREPNLHGGGPGPMSAIVDDSVMVTAVLVSHQYHPLHFLSNFASCSSRLS